jgi:hypothetical protein
MDDKESNFIKLGQMPLKFDNFVEHFGHLFWNMNMNMNINMNMNMISNN